MTDQIAIWAFPLASFVWPGLGQLLQRRTSRGIVQLVCALVLVVTVFPYLCRG